VLATRLHGLATTTGEGEGRESTTLLGGLERLLGDLEDCLEGLALVGLHGLLDVGEPRVALASRLLSRTFHFVLGTRQLFNESRGILNKEVPLASIRKGVLRIRSDCCESWVGNNHANEICVELFEFRRIARM
jgi:hypothetical protein